MDYYKILDDLGMIDMTEEEFYEKCSTISGTFSLTSDIITENDSATMEKLLFTILYNEHLDNADHRKQRGRTAPNKKRLCEGAVNED